MKYEYWFANVKGISAYQKMELRSQFLSVEEMFFASEEDLLKKGIGEKSRQAILKSKIQWNVEEAYQKMLEKRVKFVPIWSEEYPEKLKEIASPPYALYLRGKMPSENKMKVAIVGARECSAYGESMAKWFGRELAQAGVQIISGMARGIDSIAQNAALEAGGESFAVLGSGPDICYPREKIGLYTELERHGGILSEFPIGTSPLRQNFPARNRIISGLSDIILVMEAKEKSGSLITVDMALEQGKDVYALPGPITSQLSRGCNNLIKQGAGILFSPLEFLEEQGFSSNLTNKNQQLKKISLETTEKLVYSCLDFKPQNLGELIRKTKLSVPDLLDILIRLEIIGVAKEISKNNYVKV